MFFHEDPGPRNQIVLFPHNGCPNTGNQGSATMQSNQIITWTCPSDVNDSIPMRVYVWGGGGACGNSGGSGNGYGGGGGGLAISEFTPVANQQYTVTVAGCQWAYNGVGNSSSFSGAGITTMTASGGRSGDNSTDPTGNSTGETSNPQTGTNGQGGVGVGGNIVNRRGGGGGIGVMGSTNGYAGGGGAAPSPAGNMDGKRGGNHTGSYGGAGGASINFEGTTPYSSYTSCGGAGTAGLGTSSQNSGGYYSYGGVGGAGILGSGGRGSSCNNYSSSAKTQTSAGDGHGGAIWLPNQILLGGGGGGAGSATDSGASMVGCNAGCGGPGAGGGSVHTYSSSNNNAYQIAGSGGVLGGGGGAGQYQVPGNGGIAGGGGGCGYNNQQQYAYNRALGGLGGGGLVVIQYAVNV